MQILFIAMIILALLGGFLSKYQTSHADWGSSLFSVFGFKSNKQIEQEQLEKILSQRLNDQLRYLESSKVEIGSLSENLQNSLSQDNSPDILRLKSLMKDFEDENVLMIQNGKDLLSFNEERKKINQKMSNESKKSAYLTKENQLEFMEKQKEAVRKQMEVLQQLRDHIQHMKGNSSIKDNAILNDQLRAVSDKTSSYFDNIRHKQEDIDSATQNNSTKIAEMKERMDDLSRKNQDRISDNRSSLQDKTRDLNDRIRDQLEKAKERNNR
ncbi:MAG: hypothetical protein HQL15_07850 [Candidatus Omnitrophica bacterium]|nr:hypothetical protein [Candidatus Omnitrophota bacterium]